MHGVSGQLPERALVFSRQTREPRSLGCGVAAMARLAFQRRFPVDDHGLPVDQFGGIVTFVTNDAGVTSSQGKGSALVVIEGGRHPMLRPVAVRAQNLARPILELPSVRILMAGFAFLRGPLELNLARARNRLMALSAAHGAMRAQ